MDRLNCWEFMHCGREPGGKHAGECGVCPAAQDSSYDRINRGTNGGRICWYVAGTCCHGDAQGTFAQKFQDCHECEFFKFVQHQEERHFELTPHTTPVSSPTTKQ